MKPWLERGRAGAGRARRGAERRHHRRAVPRSIRSASRARRRRQLREEPLRGAWRAAGARVRRSAARRARQLAQHRALVRRACAASSVTRNCASTASPRLSSPCRWTTSIEAAAATISTARMRRSRCCRIGGVIEPYEFVRTARAISDRSRRTRRPHVVHDRRSSRQESSPLEPTTTSKPPSSADRWGPTRSPPGPDTALIGRTIPSGSKTYRAFGEYNYASGDDTPGDGVRGTFDQLYPTAHDKYGLADQVGWKNIHHLRTGLEVTAARRSSRSAGELSLVLAGERHATRSIAQAARCSRASPPARPIATSGRSSTFRRPTRHRRASSCTAATRTSSPARFSRPPRRASPTALPTSW